MNITNMRKACKKYLSEERFKPPPTKEELAEMAKEEERMRQMTGHQETQPIEPEEPQPHKPEEPQPDGPEVPQPDEPEERLLQPDEP